MSKLYPLFAINNLRRSVVTKDILMMFKEYGTCACGFLSTKYWQSTHMLLNLRGETDFDEVMRNNFADRKIEGDWEPCPSCGKCRQC